MPLYEYECRECAERLEAIQKFSDPPYKICPHCGGDLKKLISAPAIKFKGSGFYITDYAKSGSKSEGSKESSGSSGDSGSSPTTSASSSGESSSTKTESSAPKSDSSS